MREGKQRPEHHKPARKAKLMMDKKADQGAKELKELIGGILEIAILITGELRDGVEASDFVKIFSALQSDPMYMETFNGVSKIPEEAKHMSMADGLELAMIVIDKIPKLIKAASKKV